MISDPDLILRLTGRQKQLLTEHLFPGDGLGAAALLICGRRISNDRHCLSVMEVVPISYDKCVRRLDRVTWPLEQLRNALTRVNQEKLTIVKVHSHPADLVRFSKLEDEFDDSFFDTAASLTQKGLPHGSIIVLPDGQMFGRYRNIDNCVRAIDMILVAGDTIEFWTNEVSEYVPDFADRHAQILGELTIGKLRKLRCAVVGCSGTGSPTVEQLYRLGVGEIVLVDPDHVGPENLNRIVNSRSSHANQRIPKVKVLSDAIEETELGTTVIPINADLRSPDIVKQVATCDIIFSCVDNVFAKHLANKIAATYCIPLIDIGVDIKADGSGGIAHVTGAVHYLQPDGSSLLSRQVFSLADIQADILRQTDPDEYSNRLNSGYIKGADVARPAVMPVNVTFSGLGVYEFLCRLHPLRDDGNADFASQRWSLNNGVVSRDTDGERCKVVSRYLGRGDMTPLLGMPELSTPQEANHVSN